MSGTRYLILLPLKFPDGTPVPNEYVIETQIELARRFGGATLEPGRVSGMWMDEGQLVEDDLVKLWTDVEDSSEIQLFMSEIRERFNSVFARRSSTSRLKRFGSHRLRDHRLHPRPTGAQQPALTTNRLNSAGLWNPFAVSEGCTQLVSQDALADS